MKLQNVLTVLALLIGLNASAYIGDPKITKSGNKSFTVDLADWSKQTVDVKITDITGRVILNEAVKSAKGKIYNLKNLPNGGYTVTVNSQLKRLTTKIEIIENQIAILDRNIYYNPVINVEKGYFDVNTVTQNEPVTITLHKDGKKVFDKNYLNTDHINQRFNTSNLSDGDYLIIVNKGGITTSKAFSK